MEIIALTSEIFSNKLALLVTGTSLLALLLARGAQIQYLIGLGGRFARFGGLLMCLGAITVDLNKLWRGLFMVATGRPPSNYEATVQGRVMDALKKTGIVSFSCFLMSCSPALRNAAAECPVPALRAGLAVAAVAADVAERYCGVSAEPGCEEKVHTVKVIIEDSSSTLNDVCEVLPALETLKCDECSATIEAARKAACS